MPNSTISKLLTEAAIKNDDFDFRMENIDSDIQTFWDSYKRYVESVKRKKLTQRKQDLSDN